MEIKNLDSNQFADMFNMSPDAGSTEAGFNRIDGIDNNIFSTQVKTSEQIEADRLAAQILEDDKKLNADGNLIEEGANKDGEEDIFMHDEDKKKLGRKPKYEFSDTTGYLEDRIKNGKFVPIEEENDKGEKKVFIPKTPEDFDEFFELQINHKLEEKSKELTDNWYKQLSPAWQAVAKYAEKVSHPSEVIPFIEGVKNIDTISEINEKEPEGAEQIVRYRMKVAGDPQEIIDEQITSLKETNKLITTAERFKPLLVQNEQKRLAVLQKQQEDEERNYFIMVNEYRNKAIEKIESPVFGKQKLKDDEKALIYDLIAVPDTKQGGYAIYSEIDKLYENRDFDTLRDLALLLKKKDAFLGYAGKAVADRTADSLQKKLKVSITTASGAGDDGEDGRNAVIKRTVMNPNTGFRRQ